MPHDTDTAITPPDGHELPALTLDVAYYQGFLDDETIPEDQKRQLIETIWTIVVTFVDLGFGIEPVQQVIQTEADGKPDMTGDFEDAQSEKEKRKEGIDA